MASKKLTRYTKPITRNITITATYSDAGINPPVKPPIETSSIDGASSNNGKVKEIITARHTYIYTGGQLAQETITTTITPADGTSTPTGEVMSSLADNTTASAGSSTATAANGAVTASGNIDDTATASNGTTTTETLYYAYDANGLPMSLTYTDTTGTSTTYYYATNIQGDVTAILDTTGTAVVEYTYDAWGNPLTTTGSLADTLGKLNSLRYRGYLYDAETELYYLQSRYYNPKTGRFINADSYASTGQGLLGNNMFAYCNNNPANYFDSCGTRLVSIFVADATIPGRRSLPPTGEPNSSSTLYNPDGTPKQKRWYGPDGKPVRDRDYNHAGDMPFPHDHQWVNGKREKEHTLPSPDYWISWDLVFGSGIIVISVIGIVVVVLDDAIGIGTVDDPLLAPIVAFLNKGITMLFK